MLKLLFASWAASVCLHFRRSVCSVAYSLCWAFVCIALVCLLISLPFIQLLLFVPGTSVSYLNFSSSFSFLLKHFSTGCCYLFIGTLRIILRRRGRTLVKKMCFYIFYFGISHLFRIIPCVCRYQNFTSAKYATNAFHSR